MYLIFAQPLVVMTGRSSASIECFLCGTVGHRARSCPNSQGGESTGNWQPGMGRGGRGRGFFKGNFDRPALGEYSKECLVPG